jgi:hypothetical protein
MLHVLLIASFNSNKNGLINAREQRILNSFPRDIRTVRKVFDLEAETMVFASCPRCCALHKPLPRGSLLEYPARCQHQRYRTSDQCGEKLVKHKRHNNESIRTPIRPFTIQTFASFLARLLSRPGMEELLDRGTIFHESHEMWDIKDGRAITDILGPDGKPFMDGLKRGELRLAWSLSVDWFNPYHNKAAGKAASVGSIVMALLNLPPSLRYKTENLYLFGVIPGPKEPSLEQVDHYVSALVDQLLPSWKDGIWLKKTHRHPDGRLLHSAIATAVSDLPASRKVHGFAGHSAHKFCAICHLTKDQIRDFNPASWKKRDCTEHRAAAEAWRDASTQAGQKSLFKENGVRWSSMLKLPYWDPTKFVVVDSMHALLLGLVQFHSRKVVGIGDSLDKEKSTNAQPIDERELEKARKLLLSGPTITNLKRVRLPILKKLCEDNSISPSGRRKHELAKALLVSLFCVI